MELEITWGRVALVWWAYLWRNLIAIIVSLIAGAILGGILGFMLGAAGFSLGAIQIIVMPIGGILGIAISIFPIKMILGKDFGEFRLVLKRK